MNETQFLKLTNQSQKLLKDVEEAIENKDTETFNRKMRTLMAVTATLNRMWRGRQVNQ